MPDDTKSAKPSQREDERAALSAWDRKGRAGTLGSQAEASANAMDRSAALSTDAELALLRVRIIALENLMVALLSVTIEQQRARFREFIPATGATPHGAAGDTAIHVSAHHNASIPPMVSTRLRSIY